MSSNHSTTRKLAAILSLVSVALAPRVFGQRLFEHAQLPVDGNPGMIAAGDFDGDGRVDLATSNSHSGTVSVLLGTGRGFGAEAFRSMTPISLLGWTWDIAGGDLNSDGKTDLVVEQLHTTSAAVRFTALLSTGGGSFSPLLLPSPSFLFPIRATLADVNADGALDLVAVGHSFNQTSGALVTWPGAGDGTFSTPTTTSMGAMPSSLVVGDLDEDGRLDAAVGMATMNGLRLSPGDATGGFGNPSFVVAGDVPRSLVVGDFVVDGRLDLVAEFTSTSFGNSLCVLPALGGGAFGAPIVTASFGAGTNPNRLVVGDLDGDARADLIATLFVEGGIRGMRSQGDGTFAMQPVSPTGGGPYGAELSDLDGDGKLDAAVANDNTQNVTLLRGDGLGGFIDAPSASASTDPVSVCTGDWNADGFEDATVVCFSSSQLRLSLGNGTGALAITAPVIVGGGPCSVAAGDFNGDGILDVVTADALSHSLTVLHGNGTGWLLVTSTIPLGVSPTAVAVSDLDGDADVDLVATVHDPTTGTSQVKVALGFGSGYFAPPATFPTSTGTRGLGPMALTIASLNGDAAPDVVTADSVSGQISVLLGTGIGSFFTATTFAVGGMGDGPSSIATLDVDVNGTTDVVVSLPKTDRLAWLAGNGAGAFAAAVSMVAKSSSVNVIAADLDADGLSDLAVVGGDLAPFRNVGGGVFAPLNHYLAGANPVGLAPADFDGDGHVDLVVSSIGSDDVRVLVNQKP